jgi:hypothetical protein
MDLVSNLFGVQSFANQLQVWPALATDACGTVAVRASAGCKEFSSTCLRPRAGRDGRRVTEVESNAAAEDCD